ncbi:MAG TPA: hypothetical protein VKV15_13915 [Bryobacteraceae bacterium]|nr:hypothetical protein [Bryobacteraceae bacterium]
MKQPYTIAYRLATLPAAGRVALWMILMLISVSSLRAQALPSGRAGQVLSIYESFDGSASPSGALLRMSNNVGYDLNRWLGMDVNLPLYFMVPPVQQSGYTAAIPNLGNLAVDGRLSLVLPMVDYQPTVTIAFPTGSVSRGFSTGSVTYDADNHFSHTFAFITPFLDVDVGNSLNNGNGPFRTKVQLPYMTLGGLAEFKAGPELHIFPRLTISGDAYEVMPWGPQTVFSRIVRPGWVGTGGTHNRTYELASRTDGGAGLVRDNGYDVAAEYSPTRFLDLGAGFNHSAHYDLNSFSLSVGISISQLLSRHHN